MEQPALFIDEPDIVKLKDAKWPATLTIEGPLVVHVQHDELWVSLDKQTVIHQPIKDIDKNIWRALELGVVVSYDIKQLYHDLATYGVEVRFSEVHDVRRCIPD